MKKIFLFGGTGFIGSYFANIYKNDKSLKIIKINTINHKHLNLISENKVKLFWTRVLNKTNTIVYLSFNNDLKDLNKNFKKNLSKTLMPLNVLIRLISTLKKKTKIIYLSTASIYGNQEKIPVNEKAKINILNKYDLLKYLSENILISSKNKFLNYQILRLSNVYGPNLSKKKQNNRQIISKIIFNCLKKREINIFGSGKYYRDFVHVEDVSKAIKKISINNSIKKNQIYNIGSGNKITLINLFKIISKNIEKKTNQKIIFKFIKNVDKNDNSFKRNYQSNINKAKKYLKWSTKIRLINGINNLIDFIHGKN